ncbi:MAG: hypothetical protein GY696_17510, partial [Gammaproteobacteria bacterium]|nr:hypothetical protein [Gammaproteobacteria bacterium]
MNSAKRPEPNLTPPQQQALKRLQKDETRVFIPADKGNSMVAMDKSAYEQCVGSLV